jgi:hypothetical protein
MNIEQYRPIKEPKGNGSDHSIPHHKTLIKGKLVKRLDDGCHLRHTCEGCRIPIKKCNG